MNPRSIALVGAVVVLVLLAGSSPALAQLTCPFTTTGDLNPPDLTTNPRWFRDEPPNSCAANQPCGTSACAGCLFDSYVFATPAGPNPACTTVTLTTPCGGAPQFLHVVAVTGTFTPPASCTAAFLGDIGASPSANVPKSFSFNVPPATTFSVVVTGVTAGATCPSYTLDVTGCENVPVNLLDFSVGTP